MNIRDWLQSPVLLGLVRYLLATVFLVTAAGKLRDGPAFVAIVLDYRVLPYWWARRFAQTLPWLELTAGVLLLLGVGVKGAAFLSGVMLVCFMYAVGLNLLRGRKQVNCGCVGAHQSGRLRASILLRNGVLLLLSLQVVVWGQDSLLAMSLLSHVKTLLLRHVVSVGLGMPLTLVVSGLLMLFLLSQQLLRLVQLEVKR